MKKIITLALLVFAAFSTKAQLADTKWKGTLKIQDDIVSLFDFGKDNLKITIFANDMPIESMTYAVADSVISLKKTNGQSDCDNDVIGKYKFKITGNVLSIKLVSDACGDRSTVLDNTSFTKFTWPTEVKVDDAVLKQYPGVYVMDDQHKITVTFENGTLMADSQTNLVAKTKLYPTSDTKFYLHYADVNLEFVKGADNKPAKFVVHQDGKDYDWNKIN